MKQSGISITHKTAIFIIFTSLVCGWLLFFDLNFSSDPERYYSYLRSAFFDGDLNFYNEYTFYSFIQSPQKSLFLVKTATGYLWNPFSIGPALLWFPFFLSGHIIVFFLKLFSYPILMSGYSFPYLFGAALGTFFYTFCGLISIYFLSSRYSDRFASLFSVLFLFWSSPAPAYFMREPGYAHSMSFCCISLFLLSWSLFEEQDLLSRSYYPFIFLGCIGGLTCLVRWQNCLIMVFPFIGLAIRLLKRENRSKQSFLHFFYAGLLISSVFMLAMLPQLLTWKILYGDFLTVPQGDNFMHWTDPQLMKVLFSPLNGLFSWHPALLIGLLTLLFYLPKRPILLGSGLIFILFQWYVNGSVDDWFAGAAFGNRRFINCLPFFMISLSFFIDFLMKGSRKWVLSFFLIFPLWNFILFLRVYGGDLMGLKALRTGNLFFQWDKWGTLFLTFLKTNYFYQQCVNSSLWAIPWLRFLFPIVILVLLIGTFIVASWSIRSLKLLFERERQNSITGISLILLSFFSLLSLFLIYSGVTAKAIFPVHLGEDARGKIELMRIGRIDSYMGSLAPVHLLPGQNVSIFCTPPGLYQEIEVIATLSGNGQPAQQTSTIMSLVLTGISGKQVKLQYKYPLDIDRMDRDEYLENVGVNDRATIRFSWFYPTLQTVPHHWYGVRKGIDESIIVKEIVIENLSTSLELHLTGLAFLE